MLVIYFDDIVSNKTLGIVLLKGMFSGDSTTILSRCALIMRVFEHWHEFYDVVLCEHYQICSLLLDRIQVLSFSFFFPLK